MVQLKLKDAIFNLLAKDDITLQILQSDITKLGTYIELLLENTAETKLCKLYTMSRQLIYLIKNFSKSEDTLEDIKNSLAVSNYLALCDKDKVEQGAALAYESKFIKNYLKYSNTILNIADKVYTFGSNIPDCYLHYRKKMLRLQPEIYKSILDEPDNLVDKEFWIETLRFVSEQVDKEISYLDNNTDEPSERMMANMGISRAQYHGIQSLLDYNQSYKI